MKKKRNTLICIIVIFILLSNILIMYDSHVSVCTHIKCKQCLIIYNIKEIIKNICIIGFLAVLFISSQVINTILETLIYNFNKNLVRMKVQLNE